MDRDSGEAVRRLGYDFELKTGRGLVATGFDDEADSGAFASNLKSDADRSGRRGFRLVGPSVETGVLNVEDHAGDPVDVDLGHAQLVGARRDGFAAIGRGCGNGGGVESGAGRIDDLEAERSG